MKKNPFLPRHSDCCGCGACQQKCPHGCITMQTDEEGFLYPIVNKQTCVGCLLCETVCHVLHREEPHEPIKAYAAHSQNPHTRKISSSGGMFTEIATYIIVQGGYVFGARFDEHWGVVLDYTNTKEGLVPFQGSKYVQASSQSVFCKAQRLLREGKKVLFTGTSCQIAALKTFLQKDYEQLITLDVICHGVPSPKVWNHYLHKTVGIKDSEIMGISFRKKTEGWRKYHMGIQLATGNMVVDEFHRENSFMNTFLTNLSLRPSCFDCKAKQGRAKSDITLADFWGVENFSPKDDDLGINLILVNTQKGNELINSLEVEKMEVDPSTALTYNPSWSKSYCEPYKRKLFMRYYFLFEKHFKEFFFLLNNNTCISKRKKIILFAARFLKTHIGLKIDEHCLLSWIRVFERNS